jgi:hypothetical protein
MIIPIGIDCGLATYLRDHHLRTCALPFDWVVSYNGVAKCIEDDFRQFIPPSNQRHNHYDIYFWHDFTAHTFDQDTVKYKRRIERFETILATSQEEVLFIRKGHAGHHHTEQNSTITTIRSDLEDTEALDIVLQRKYPMLRYKLIVVLVCSKCFDPTTVYTSVSERIQIYNIATPEVDNPRFMEQIEQILSVSSRDPPGN